jgi:hypothetical protein
MSVFEIGMLVCFGLSWPVSIVKTINTKCVSGKSTLFLLIVIAGYLFGIIHKILYSRDLVILLYALNLILVAVDLGLCRYYSRKQSARA